MGASSGHEFTEKQADEILKRAIDLQAKQSVLPENAQSQNMVSFQQLYRSAAEIGIDPSHVRKAAEEVASRSVKRSEAAAGEPNVVEQEFPVAMLESDFPAFLEHLRAETNAPGAAQVIGGTLEWQAFLMARREILHVAVVPAGDVTRVKIRSTSPFGGNFPFSPWFGIAFAIGICLMGLIPLATFGFRFGSYLMVLPFLFIGLIFPLFQFVIRKGLAPKRRKGVGGDTLMQSIATWMEHLRASRDSG